MNEKEAEYFAELAHSEIGQKRKYTNEPYIVHPRNVAYLVKMVGGSSEMVCAAYLHDVLEDVAPKCSLFNAKQILKRFGKEVLTLVEWLTDKSKPEDGNRETRKKIDRDHILSAPADAQTIKLADLIDNSMTIVQHDPDFSKVYLREKRLLLGYLLKGNIRLWQIANDILIRNGY